MESLEKQFVTAFAESWNVTAPAMLDRPSTLKLLALRDVAGEGMASALAVAVTWTSAFVVPCSGGLTGLAICLFKYEEVEVLERLLKQETDGTPRTATRGLVNQTLEQTAVALGEDSAVSFDPAVFIDLTNQDARLSAIVGDRAWIGTIMLTVGEELETQALVLYAPNGSLDAATASNATLNGGTSQPIPAFSGQQAQGGHSPAAKRTAGAPREEALPKNIDRLLDVELDVVVRFGSTNMQLRDVVRMGVGTMIELNRAIDEPVELLVNGRPLARGEVVVVDGYYGVRITEIGAPADRVPLL